MSWQNYALKKYLRQRVKKRLKPEMSIEKARRELEGAIRTFMPDPPKEVRISPAEVGGVGGEWVEPRDANVAWTVLYFHGGGFAMGSPRSHRGITCALALALHARVLSLDYRLAPEHPYPAAVEDGVSAYRALLGNGCDPKLLVVAGDQAGACLTVTTMLFARDSGAPLPAAGVLLSPWVDLALTGRTIRDNAKRDPALTPMALERAAEHYLDGGNLRDPKVSPLYGNLEGLPPTLIQASDTEILLDDAVRLAGALQQAGVAVFLDTWSDVPHMWQLGSFGGKLGLPEGRAAVREIARFLAMPGTGAQGPVAPSGDVRGV